MLKKILWYIRSDVELMTTTVWGIDGKKRIDGFYFYTKKPFSKSYQWCSTVGLEYTYPILSLLQSSMKEKKKAFVLKISVGMGYERMVILRSSYKKLENQMTDMIKQIQQQYENHVSN